MQIRVEPQDKRPSESLTFVLSAGVAQRLRDYAGSLSDSKPDYVIEQILQQVLPPEKKGKTNESEASTKGKGKAASAGSSSQAA